MNGKRVMMLTIFTALMMSAGSAFSQDSVESLRGDNSIDATSKAPDPKDWKSDGGPVPREFAQQPPLIPHATDGFTINLDFNMCLNCHNIANAGQPGAATISPTHLVDREGKKLEDPSGLRYSCTQCHVKQRDAAPLVENTFKAAGNPE